MAAELCLCCSQIQQSKVHCKATGVRQENQKYICVEAGGASYFFPGRVVSFRKRRGLEMFPSLE